MGADLPKQFLPVGGKPVLMRTLEAFLRLQSGGAHHLGVAARPTGVLGGAVPGIPFLPYPHEVADGGATRFHSVQQGLRRVEAARTGGGYTDGGAPVCVARRSIARCFRLAAEKRAVVPVTDVVENPPPGGRAARAGR